PNDAPVSPCSAYLFGAHRSFFLWPSVFNSSLSLSVYLIVDLEAQQRSAIPRDPCGLPGGQALKSRRLSRVDPSSRERVMWVSPSQFGRDLGCRPQVATQHTLARHALTPDSPSPPRTMRRWCSARIAQGLTRSNHSSGRGRKFNSRFALPLAAPRSRVA